MCARVRELKVKESLHFAEALRPAGVIYGSAETTAEVELSGLHEQ